MKNKRLVLKPGYFVTNEEIKQCHFKEVVTSDMWGGKTDEFLVVISDEVCVVGKHKCAVYASITDAHREFEDRKRKHIAFCEGQIEYYQKRLTEK